MVKYIKLIAFNPLISGSFFLFTGGILASFFNFLFNILMSRNLAVSDYGTLISLISIVTLLSIPANALAPTVITVAGGYFAKNDIAHIHAFYLKLLKGLVIAGFSVFIIFLLFTKQISNFFNIDNEFSLTIAIIGVALFYILSLNNSFLQAKLSFKFLSFIGTISAFLKVTLAFLFVLLGFGIFGAVTGFVFSILLTILICFYYFRKIVFYKSDSLPKISYKSLIAYGIPSSIIIFCLNSLVSTDILLVKHFFDPHQAGLYAGLSLVGRVIFFVSAPVGIVMFPTLVRKFEEKQNYLRIFFMSIVLVGILSISISFFYLLFSDYSIIFFLKKSEYLEISKYLFNFSIFISLYSIVSLFSYYFLSVKQTSFMYILLASSVFQALMITIKHDNFNDIITISIIASVFVILASIVQILKKNKILAI